jgi:opacity protein-like surface antigen
MIRARIRPPWLSVFGGLLIGAVQPGGAWAAGTVAVEVGKSWADDIQVRRLAVDRAWARRWEGAGGWRLQPRWELSAGRLRPTHASSDPETAEVYEAALRLVVRFLPDGRRGLFLGAGSGPVYITNDTVGEHKLGYRLQFRSHAGVGVIFGPRNHLELAYRFAHTSNAHLGRPNPGVNFHTLRFGIAF